LLLKGVAEAILLPPMLFLYLGLGGLLITRWSRRAGVVLAWFGMLGLLLLAVPAVGTGMYMVLEWDLPLTPPPDAPPQAIVILSGDISRSGTDMLLLQPGPLSLQRESAGANLYRRTHLPILISGGSLKEGEPPLASVMADSMEHDFQVPVQWQETRSLDTWENAHQSAAILREHGIHSVYVVTQAWHMRRAILAFADTGIAVTAAPTRMDRMQSSLVRDLVPAPNAWTTSYYAIHEFVGCAFYALR
jgi:uncharacterized SAM-binding protein YcdF (DUF218 family)